MLSLQTKHLLANFLLQIQEIERKAEPLKTQLCSIPNFEPYSYFKSLTPSADKLQLEQIQHLMRKVGVHIKVQGIIAVLLAHDTSHTGSLNYNEQIHSILKPIYQLSSFLRMVITNENQDIRQDVSLREKNPKMEFEIGIHKAFLDLISQEATAYLSLQEIKNQLQTRYDFDIYDCFSIIDSSNTGQIDFQLISMFLKEYCRNQFQEKSIVYLMRRILKHEPKKQISFQHFQSVLKSSENYIGQFSPERLEKHKKDLNSAQKMYTIYEGFMGSSSKATHPSPSTPKKKTQLTLTSPFNNARIPTDDIQWTPVRKVNKSSFHHKIEDFQHNIKRIDDKQNIPMRHSPLQITPQQEKKKKYRIESYYCDPRSFEQDSKLSHKKTKSYIFSAQKISKTSTKAVTNQSLRNEESVRLRGTASKFATLSKTSLSSSFWDRY